MLGKNCKIAAASGSDEPEAAKREMRKYHNIPTTVDGVRFASKKEAARYEQLKLMVRAKAITDLTLQPVFPYIEIAGQKICKYIADFEYTENGKRIVEDVKSTATATPVYKLKKKLVKALHNIDVQEV